MALSAKQQRFCEEYLIDLNGTQAAIRAGYSKKTAKEIAAENLTKPNIQEYIQEKQKTIAEKLNITQEWVLNRFKDISDRCVQAEAVKFQDAKGNWVETGEYRFDSSGANKATEMIGKHLGLFEKDNSQKKQELTLTPSLTDTQFKQLISKINASSNPG